MLLSGGTTSLSKLIPRTHDDYVLNARSVQRPPAGSRARPCSWRILAARTQLQPRLAGHARRVPRRRHVVHRAGTDAAEIFTTGRARARDRRSPPSVPLITDWLNAIVARALRPCRR